MTLQTALETTNPYAAIAQYENDPVVHRIAAELGVDITNARGVFEDTKRFLYLGKIAKKSIRPTKTIDEGWHAFVLHTKDYAAFCTRFLGGFIHHQPDSSGISAEAKQASFDYTNQIATDIFGDDLGNAWKNSMLGDCESGMNPGDCSPDSNCESAPSDCALN